jgi:DNA mismatch repair ATPase MutS
MSVHNTVADNKSDVGTTKEYLHKIKKVFIDPKTFDASEMLGGLDIEKSVNNNLVESITSTLVPHSTKVSKIGKDVYNDVEFFKCFNDKNTLTVFDTISKCQLLGSKNILQRILEVPIYDRDLLQKRQNLIQGLQQKDDVIEFTSFKNNEADVLWLFEEIDQNLKDLYQMVYFKFCMLKPLNKHPNALTCFNLYRIIGSPLIGILSPIIYFIVPYLIIAFKFKLKISFKVYIKILIETFLNTEFSAFGSGGNYKYFKAISYVLSIVFYFQGILNSFEISKTLYKVSKHLVQKVNNIVMFLQHANSVIQKTWSNELYEAFLESNPSIQSNEMENKYIQTLKTVQFSLHTNFGKQLHTYLTFDKDIIKSILLKSYILESLHQVNTFKQQYNLCFTEYIESATPTLHLQNVFHPCIDLMKVVKNSIELNTSANAIITGPNAGGKSTFVKALLINVLLSQTVGISVADSCVMTPFHNISSQINIPDAKGYESLFEAEMYRCKDKLDLLKENPDKLSFFVMDEIFNSTNPVEGIAGAYAIANNISQYTNCLLILTTHYIYLTKLKKTKRFKNYKMNVIKDDNDITYPYTLHEGVSKQYIALDLLKKNGFDEGIISEAMMIKEKLTGLK